MAGVPGFRPAYGWAGLSILRPSGMTCSTSCCGDDIGSLQPRCFWSRDLWQHDFRHHGFWQHGFWRCASSAWEPRPTTLMPRAAIASFRARCWPSNSETFQPPAIRDWSLQHGSLTLRRAAGSVMHSWQSMSSSRRCASRQFQAAESTPRPCIPGGPTLAPEQSLAARNDDPDTHRL
jgi:hypothetical protein